VGAQESNVATHKSDWLNEARSAIKVAFPKIRALVYFSHKGLPHEAPGIDWRVQTSPLALKAFADMANDPYFNPRATGGEPAPVTPEVGLPLVLPLSGLVVLVVFASQRWRRRKSAASASDTREPEQTRSKM